MQINPVGLDVPPALRDWAPDNSGAIGVDGLDGAGTPYRIVCAPDSAIATSAGRDRTFDTGDDVKSDQP
jgi:hypothetical protein